MPALTRILLLWALGLPAVGGDFRVTPDEPTLDRWMYPFNFEAGTRRVAPTFGSFDPRFDTRDAQFLLGWDTGASLATNAGPANYLIRQLRITLTSAAPGSASGVTPFVYDATHDAVATYMTNQPGFEPDADPGRPIELFGVTFRGGFDEETFLENSPFGPLGPVTNSTISIGTRNASASVHDTNGVLIDIANNVGQLNASWTNAPFEVRPWAVGVTTNAVPGEEMPDAGTLQFDVDLTDPLVVGYLQRALDQGRLRLMVSSLSPAGQSTPGGVGMGGGGAYPWWATRENLLYDPPRLEIEGTLVTAEDTDGDGLPDDWERFWFHALSSTSGDDPDHDGAANGTEFGAGTDPTDAGSVLALEAVREASGALRLRFEIAPSRRYAVESSSNLVAWRTEAGSLVYPEPGVAEWSPQAMSDGAPAGMTFLRVRVSDPSP